jgi:hypothetical protein
VDNAAPILVFVLFGVVAIVALYLGHKAAEKRRQELWGLASELGMVFDPGRDGPGSEHTLFGAFKRGHSRRVMNTMRGDLEMFGRPCPCVLGDYEYKVTSSNGKSTSTTTYRFSYILLRLPWAVPDLSIRRENLLDKIAGAVGFDDIDFESEEFSRRFHVKCRDRKFAYDMLHPRAMEFLLGAEAEPIEFEGGWCCITDGRGRWSPPQFRGRVEFVRAFAGLWPEHLVQELESRRGASGMRLS